MQGLSNVERQTNTFKTCYYYLLLYNMQGVYIQLE